MRKQDFPNMRGKAYALEKSHTIGLSTNSPRITPLCNFRIYKMAMKKHKSDGPARILYLARLEVRAYLSSKTTLYTWPNARTNAILRWKNDRWYSWRDKARDYLRYRQKYIVYLNARYDCTYPAMTLAIKYAPLNAKNRARAGASHSSMHSS